MLYVSFFIPLSILNDSFKGPKAVEKWFDKLPHAKQKVTKFHFYFHDIVSGKNPSAVPIIQSTSPIFFGYVAMIDDPLTVGLEPDSTIVGRAQGIYGGADQNEVALLMTLNDPLTVGPEPNSTIVGRAQGIYGLADQNEDALLMTLNFVFTTGKYKELLKDGSPFLDTLNITS
uniref:Dirigent protein n=1 Tax=Solanum tuberosum TaxID=4113 RepID=M1BZH4_SOLTU